MAKRELTPEDHARLNRLAALADEKKKIADEARTKCRKEKATWQQWYDLLQKEWLDAHAEYVGAYKKLGIKTRQQMWQLRKYHLGLCRQCGDPRLPNGKLCQPCLDKSQAHLAKIHAMRRKKK